MPTNGEEKVPEKVRDRDWLRDSGFREQADDQWLCEGVSLELLDQLRDPERLAVATV